MKKRIVNGDQGINGLDKACKQHDIAYDIHPSGIERKKADNILASAAWDRFKSSDASIGERISALSVAGIMKAKTKIGMGVKPIKNKNKVGKKKNVAKKKCAKKILRSAISVAKKSLLNKNASSVKEATKLALSAATAAVRQEKIPKRDLVDRAPRIIPVPKTGGIIPLIPVFAGLSALGALMGGTASVVNAVNTTKNAKKALNESSRHNQMMESIALGKDTSGEGVYLRPYRKGLGVYLGGEKSYKKN